MNKESEGIQIFWLNLKSIKWWKWLRSPLKGLLLFEILIIKSLLKSINGIKNKIIIFSALKIYGLFSCVEINKNPIILLMMDAPLLPKKILVFGFRDRIINIETNKHILNKEKLIKININRTVNKYVDKDPLIPSNMFKIFCKNTKQNIVKNIDIGGVFKYWPKKSE